MDVHFLIFSFTIHLFGCQNELTNVIIQHRRQQPVDIQDVFLAKARVSKLMRALKEGNQDYQNIVQLIERRYMSKTQFNIMRTREDLNILVSFGIVERSEVLQANPNDYTTVYRLYPQKVLAQN